MVSSSSGLKHALAVLRISDLNAGSANLALRFSTPISYITTPKSLAYSRTVAAILLFAAFLKPRIFLIFTRDSRMLGRLSVYLSHCCIVSKRCKLRSRNLHCAGCPKDSSFL